MAAAGLWISGSKTRRPQARRVAYADGTGPETLREGDVELSHWIPNRTPARYKADTSTGICLTYVADPARASYDLVVNNHADADGVLSVFVLLEPELALRHRDTLVQAAEIGDFWGWGDVPAQALYQAVVEAIRDAAGADPLEVYGRALASIPAALARGSEPQEPGSGWFFDAAARIAKGRVRRQLVAPRFARYLVPRAIAADLPRWLLCPAFSAPLQEDLGLPPHVRAREDRERLHLFSVETREGWYHDLCYPGYLWADTPFSWRPPDPLVPGPIGGRDALLAALARLQAAERGRGRWTPLEGDTILDAEVPGRGWPVAASFVHDAAPAISTLPPDRVAAELVGLAG